MTGYKFNFNAEAARARAEYPSRTRHTVFLDTSAPDAAKKLRDCLRDKMLVKTRRKLEEGKAEFEQILAEARAKHTPPARLRRMERKFREEYRTVRKAIAANIGRAARSILKNRNFMQSAPSNPGHFVIGVDARGRSDGLLGSASAEKEKFFAFWHEVGHRVIEGGHTTRGNRGAAEKAQGEKCADVFALLTGFRRGVLTRRDAAELARNRVLGALANIEDEHLTQEAVGAAARRAKGKARSATPRQTAKAARDIARRFPASRRDLRAISAANNAFYAACDVEALAQYIGQSEGSPRKEARSAMDCFRRAAEFRGEAARLFSRMAAKAPKGSAEQRYCRNVVNAAKTAARTRA